MLRVSFYRNAVAGPLQLAVEVFDGLVVVLTEDDALDLKFLL